MRALVTGGAGFIGSHLVDALVARGDEVTVLDDLSSGRWENIASALNRGVRFHPVSVTDAKTLWRILAAASPDTVFHLAAQIDVRHAVTDPELDASVNVLGTVNLLEAARASGVRRFVFASSGGAIYGDALEVPTPETAAPRPSSPYAASKAAGETYLELYRELHGLSGVSLRLANVYGPRQAGSVVAIFCAAPPGGTVTLYGDGSQTRDLVYVGDVVEAFLAAAEDDGGGRLNVATGTETSVLELARTLNLRARYAAARPGEVQRSCLDPSAALAQLGWRARTTLAEGLVLTSTARESRPARAASSAP